MFYDLVMHKDEKGYARRVTLGRFEYAAKKDDYPKSQIILLLFNKLLLTRHLNGVIIAS